MYKRLNLLLSVVACHMRRDLRYQAEEGLWVAWGKLMIDNTLEATAAVILMSKVVERITYSSAL